MNGTHPLLTAIAEATRKPLPKLDERTTDLLTDIIRFRRTI